MSRPLRLDVIIYAHKEQLILNERGERRDCDRDSKWKRCSGSMSCDDMLKVQHKVDYAALRFTTSTLNFIFRCHK